MLYCSVALVLSIQVTGCGSGSGSSPTAVSRADDPNLPAEVREYEAKNAKRLADRAAKSSGAKSGKSASKYLLAANKQVAEPYLFEFDRILRRLRVF